MHMMTQSHNGTMSPNGSLSGPDGEDYSGSTDNNAHPNHVCTFFVGVSVRKRFFLQTEAQCVLYFLPLMRYACMADL